MNSLFGTSLSAGAGALAAAALTTINPIAGAIVGGTTYLSGRAVNYICEKTDNKPDSTVGKVTQYSAGLLGGAALATVAATACGFPITFSAAAVLGIATAGIVATRGAIFGVAVLASIAATIFILTTAVMIDAILLLALAAGCAIAVTIAGEIYDFATAQQKQQQIAEEVLAEEVV